MATEDKDTITDKETTATKKGAVTVNPNADILKQAASDLYTSNYIATDDVAVRLEKLEAYLNKVDGVEVEE